MEQRGRPPLSSSIESGYRSADYARAFDGFGRPQHLSRSGAWILERPIKRTARVDAMGLYPLLCCTDWSAIGSDLDNVGADWVSVTAVTDPLGDYDAALLRRNFDRVIPYNEHFIAELTGPPESFVSKSHRQNARRALRKVSVEVCTVPMDFLDDWVALFSALVCKHGISGLRAFSRQSFAQQICTPGMVMFRASVDGQTVGLDLWYVDGDVAHGHLVAFNDQGYANRASYATKWTLLMYFAQQRVHWVNFGGLPGGASAANAGLEHFKRGWSNTTRPTYLCGSIFDEAAYRELSRGSPETAFFPAYRKGEI